VARGNLWGVGFGTVMLTYLARISSPRQEAGDDTLLPGIKLREGTSS
jgi:hypothetical protein